MSKNTKLINELRECLAKEFSKRLVEAMPAVSEALFEIANNTDDADNKRAILGARDVFESRSLDWEEATRLEYIKRFNEKMSGDEDQMSKTMTFSVDSLKLVEDEEMREEITLGNVSKRLRDACDYELFQLTKRVEALAEVTQMTDRQNPVLPRLFCRALLSGLSAADVNVTQRCEILSAGSVALTEVLNETLKEGNEVLVSRGFMIEIPVAYGKPIKSAASRVPLSLSTGSWQAARGGGGSGGGGGGRGSGSGGGAGKGGGGNSGGGGGGGGGDAHPSLPDLFARLLARLPGGDVPAAAPAGAAAGGGAAGGSAPTLSQDQLLARLLTAAPAPAGAVGSVAAPGASGAGPAGAGGGAAAPAAGGVQVTLDPKLLEALERFASSAAIPAAPAAAAPVAPGGTAPAGAVPGGVVGAGGGGGGGGAVAAPQAGAADGAPLVAGDGSAFPTISTSEVGDAGANDQTQPLPAVERANYDAPTERLDAVAAAPKPVLTNLVRQAAPVLAPTMAPVQTVITDVVAGVFDRIFEAPDIPDSIKALIGKLQLQIFKASMQDPQIFTNPDHPIRRFVDELADVGVKRQQSLRQGDPVYERISTIVNNLHQNFDVDPHAIERANHQLSAFIQAEEDSAQGVIFDSVVEVQQQEEVEMGESMAAFEVDRRFAGKMYLRKIKEFVRTHWQTVLAKDYLVDGEDGEQWKADLATLDELLWSISPTEAAKDRPKLLKLLPTLLARLNAGLDRVGVSQETREPYFQVMVAVHTSLLRPAKSKGAQEANDELEAQPVATASDPRAKLRKRTTTIERGQWIEMTDEDGTVQRCRLSWVSPLKETFVLKNYDTKEAVTLTAEEFQMLEGEGRIKLIEEHSLTERSIQGAIMGMLDKPGEKEAATAPAA
jgi:hypothetical protein